MVGVDLDVDSVHTNVYTVYMSKARIFSAARTVLEKAGVPGLSMRRIAQESGMSPMALYRHFTDKEALLDALMVDGLAAWEERVRAIRSQAPLEWLDQLGEAFLAFALEEPHRFDAAFFLPAPNARQYPHEFAAGDSPVIAMAVSRIDHAKEAGVLNDTRSLDIALTLSALAQGLISMYRARRFSCEDEFVALYRSTVRGCLGSWAGVSKRKSS